MERPCKHEIIPQKSQRKIVRIFVPTSLTGESYWGPLLRSLLTCLKLLTLATNLVCASLGSRFEISSSSLRPSASLFRVRYWGERVRERERQRVKNEEMGARERGGEGGEETWRK